MKTKKHTVLKVLLIIILLILISIVTSLYFSKYGLKVEEYDLKYEKAEASFKIVQLSDLHSASFGKDNGRLIEKVRGEKPDIICFTGDTVSSTDVDFSVATKLVGTLTEIAPVYVSLGNHEFKFGGDIRAVTRETGATLLDDSFTEFSSVKIGGLTSGFEGARQGTFKKTPPPDTGFIKEFDGEPGFKILLCHHPEYYPRYLKNTGIDLILSGHAHGGQWRFFGRGLYAPGQGIFPKYTSGLYDGRLVVSAGVGDSHSVPRINNDYEIIIIEIKKEVG